MAEGGGDNPWWNNPEGINFNFSPFPDFFSIFYFISSFTNNLKKSSRKSTYFLSM